MSNNCTEVTKDQNDSNRLIVLYIYTVSIVYRFFAKATLAVTTQKHSALKLTKVVVFNILCT